MRLRAGPINESCDNDSATNSALSPSRSLPAEVPLSVGSFVVYDDGMKSKVQAGESGVLTGPSRAAILF